MPGSHTARIESTQIRPIYNNRASSCSFPSWRRNLLRRRRPSAPHIHGCVRPVCAGEYESLEFWRDFMSGCYALHRFPARRARTFGASTLQAAPPTRAPEARGQDARERPVHIASSSGQYDPPRLQNGPVAQRHPHSAASQRRYVCTAAEYLHRRPNSRKYSSLSHSARY